MNAPEHSAEPSPELVDLTKRIIDEGFAAIQMAIARDDLDHAPRAGIVTGLASVLYSTLASMTRTCEEIAEFRKAVEAAGDANVVKMADEHYQQMRDRVFSDLRRMFGLDGI